VDNAQRKSLHKILDQAIDADDLGTKRNASIVLLHDILGTDGVDSLIGKGLVDASDKQQVQALLIELGRYFASGIHGGMTVFAKDFLDTAGAVVRETYAKRHRSAGRRDYDVDLERHRDIACALAERAHELDPAKGKRNTFATVGAAYGLSQDANGRCRGMERWVKSKREERQSDPERHLGWRWANSGMAGASELGKVFAKTYADIMALAKPDGRKYKSLLSAKSK